MNNQFFKKHFPTYFSFKNEIHGVIKLVGIISLIVLWIVAFAYIPFLSSMQDGFMEWLGQYR